MVMSPSPRPRPRPRRRRSSSGGGGSSSRRGYLEPHQTLIAWFSTSQESSLMAVFLIQNESVAKYSSSFGRMGRQRRCGLGLGRDDAIRKVLYLEDHGT